MQKEAAAPTKVKLVGAVVQAVRILQVLDTSDRPMGVSSLAREAKVNPSTAFNILRTLVIEELVAFDELSKTYTLGGRLLKLSRKLIGQSLVNEIRPDLNRLAWETGCLVGLWQAADDRMVLAERFVSDRPMRLDMEVKYRLPLMLGAVGRAHAARIKLKDSELREHYRKLRWEGQIDVKAYIEDIREAERRGYGVDRGSLYSGIISIGAVIVGIDGRVTYGLTASDFEGNFTETKIAQVGERMASLARQFSAPEAHHAPSGRA